MVESDGMDGQASAKRCDCLLCKQSQDAINGWFWYITRGGLVTTTDCPEAEKVRV